MTHLERAEQHAMSYTQYGLVVSTAFARELAAKLDECEKELAELKKQQSLPLVGFDYQTTPK